MKELIDALVQMDEERTVELVKKMIAEQKDINEILECSREAMALIGQKYERKEYFLPELIMSGEILKNISELVKNQVTDRDMPEKKQLGKVLIGTVVGDVHDIGKNIVTFMLDVNGFEVKDIGVDVPVDVFVSEIKEFEPQVVGMSGLLTLAYDSMKETIEAIRKSGLREDLKIMIGGGCMSEDVANYVGADAYGEDAVAAVNLTKRWLGVHE